MSMLSSSAFRRLVPLFALLASSACAAPIVEDEDDGADSSEEAVTAPRPLEKLTAPTRLLAAKTYAARPPARFRSDIEVAAPAGLDKTPRQVRRATSRVFTWTGADRVMLRGNAAGDAPIVADDFVLVEVLDAATGALLGARSIGATFGIRLGGAAVQPAPVEGASAEITHVVPVDRPFRLRITGLDVGGAASVSDVYLSTVAPPPDPFEEGWCAGPVMTSAQALKYIPPGLGYGQRIPVTDSNVRTVVRTCGPTGCGEWRDAIYTGDDALEGDIVVSSLGAVWRVGVSFSAEELRGRIAPYVERDGVRLFAARVRPEAIVYRETGRFAWNATVTLRTDTAYETGSTSARMGERGSVFGETTVHVGKDCYQLRNLRRERSKEILTVAYGRFAAP